MGAELHTSWTCGGCAVTVRWVDGEAHPEPRAWKDGLCLKCVKREAGEAEAAQARQVAREKAEAAEMRAALKKTQARAFSDDQRDEVERLLRSGLSNGAIAEKIGPGFSRAIGDLRNGLGLPSANVIKAERADAEVERFICENPDAGYDATKEATGAARASMERVCERLADTAAVEIPWLRTRAQTTARRRQLTAAVAA